MFPPTGGNSGLGGGLGGIGGPGLLGTGPGAMNTGLAPSPAGTNPNLLRNMNYDPFAEISERGPTVGAGPGPGPGQLQGGYPQQPPGTGMPGMGPNVTGPQQGFQQ